MKYCDEHWIKTQEAVKDAGLSNLISEDSKAAVEYLVDTSQTKIPDPLMDVSMMVYNRAVEMFGIGMMMVDEKGNEYCPVCIGLKNPCPCDRPECHLKTEEQLNDYWINGPVRAEKDYIESLGLLNI